MVDDGVWCIGTPDDLTEAILALDEESGGFGQLILLATEVGTREQVLHSYELLARYVMPKFQGSLDSLVQSANYFANIRERMAGEREAAQAQAGTDYQDLRKTF
jgi:limonene 1,2-monooxygenase